MRSVGDLATSARWLEAHCKLRKAHAFSCAQSQTNGNGMKCIINELKVKTQISILRVGYDWNVSWAAQQSVPELWARTRIIPFMKICKNLSFVVKCRQKERKISRRKELSNLRSLMKMESWETRLGLKAFITSSTSSVMTEQGKLSFDYKFSLKLNMYATRLLEL